MSILIKDMEMPTCCRACWLKMNCDDCEGWECVCVPLNQQIGYLDDLLADKRRDDCPLVPVPPHGRLIDADALRQSIKESIDECHKWADEVESGEMYARVSQSLGTFVECSLRVKAAPTIIPAEEG